MPSILDSIDSAQSGITEWQIDDGEYLAPSSALWRAGAAALEGLAEVRGWEVDQHKRFHDIERRIAPEIDKEVLLHGMGPISLMRHNSVDDYDLDDWWLNICVDDIRSLIEAIEEVAHLD